MENWINHIYIYIYIYTYTTFYQHQSIFMLGGLTTPDRCRACGKTASLKDILLTGCEYALRSYMWRHTKSLRLLPRLQRLPNKGLNNITNRPIHFVKEGNISKLSCKNKHRSSLLDDHTDWHVTTDLEPHFVFPTEIVLTTQILSFDLLN